MIKSSTKLLKALMLLVVAFWATFESYADSPRKVVVEQHTSTTCAPCAAANPAFHEWIDQNLDYVVPLIFHQNFPAPGDPMYTHNPSMNLFFWQRFGAQGIPTCNVNGGPATHPTTLRNQNYAPITSLKGTISKVDMSIELEESGNNFIAKVTVSTSIALNNHIMRAFVIEHPIDYSSPPGSNGETHFPWVPRKAMVETGQYGEALSLAAGQSKTFEYTFAKNSAWQAGKISLSAYVQDNSTKEILQGESSQFGATLNLSDNYLKAAPSVAKEANFTVSNDKTFELDVTMSINAQNSFLPEGWTAVIGGSNTAKIASKQSVSSKVVVTPGKDAGLAMIAIDIDSKNGNKIGLTTTKYLYVLSTETKLVYYALSGDSPQPFIRSITSIAKHFREYATIPLTPEFLNAFPLSDFKTIILSDNYNTRGTLLADPNFAISLDNAIKGGTNVVFTSVLDLYFVNGGDPNFTPNQTIKTILNDYFGVQYSSLLSISQQNGNQIQIFPLTISGVSGDIVSDNVNYIINQYNSSTHPYYTRVIELIKPNAQDVVPILYAQGTQLPKEQTITGVRRQYGNSRLVYLSHTFDLIQDITNRRQLIEQILNWVNPITTGDKPTISVASSVNFDETEIGKTSTKAIEIENTGKAMLVVDKLGLVFDSEGKDKIFTYDVKLPINIPAGGKASINVTFNPKNNEESFDILEISSNDTELQVAQVSLLGKGILGDNTEPVISVSKESLAFGKVGVNESKIDLITITNAGKNNLLINEIYMNSLDNIFTIDAPPPFPIIIPSGDNYNLSIKFSPKANQTYTNIVNIKSNSSSNATQTIALSGEGDATSVRDGEAGDDQVFTFSVGPNPFESSAVVTYNVAATVGAQNVSLNLVDTKGNVVKSIINGQVEMGSYTIDMTSAGLSSGAYMLVANVGANTYTLPVTIKK